MITVTVTNRLEVRPLDRLPAPVLRQIKARLTFANPAYLEAEKRGFWTGNLEREIKGYRIEDDSLIIPRGFTRQLVGILHQAGIRFQVEDQRLVLASVARRLGVSGKPYAQGTSASP